MQIQADGTNVVGPSAQSVGTSTLSTACVGAVNLNGTVSTFANAFIAELFAWSMALSASDQKAVRSAMEKKYRIPGT